LSARHPSPRLPNRFAIVGLILLLVARIPPGPAGVGPSPAGEWRGSRSGAAGAEKLRLLFRKDSRDGRSGSSPVRAPPDWPGYPLPFCPAFPPDRTGGSRWRRPSHRRDSLHRPRGDQGPGPGEADRLPGRLLPANPGSWARVPSPSLALISYGASFATHDPREKETAVLLLESMAFTGILVGVGRFVIAAERPEVGDDVYFFRKNGHGFSGDAALAASVRPGPQEPVPPRHPEDRGGSDSGNGAPRGSCTRGISHRLPAHEQRQALGARRLPGTRDRLHGGGRSCVIPTTGSGGRREVRLP